MITSVWFRSWCGGRLCRWCTIHYYLDMKNVLLTGGNNGIGLHTVRQLLKSETPIQVIFTHRSPVRQDLISSFQPRNPESSAVAVHLDLLSSQSIKTCASAVTALAGSLNAIVLNAALYTAPDNDPKLIGEEKVNEVVIANVIGSAALLKLLKPTLIKGNDRVVWVGSQLHARIKHDVLPQSLEDLTTIGDPAGPPAYGVSKLIALHYARASKDVNIVTVSPGFIPTTDLSRSSPWYARWAMYYLISLLPITSTVEEGAARVVAALEGNWDRGVYLSKGEITSPKAECMDATRNAAWKKWVDEKVEQYLQQS